MQKFDFKEIGSYLLRGTFIIAPIFFTLWAIIKILSLLDAPVQGIFYAIFGFKIYGLGLLTVIALLIGIGYFGTTVLVNSIFKFFEKLIFKIPFVKEIYTSIKDIIGAFTSDKNKFDNPVLVEVYKGVFRIGFITNKDLSKFKIESDMVAVYFPFSYALTGEMMLVKKDAIQNINTKDVKDLMKFTMSGGIVHNEEAQD